MKRNIIIVSLGVWFLSACGAAEPGESANEGPVEHLQQALETPSCDDGVKNGNEEHVDCGGSCEACVPVRIDSTPTVFTDWGGGYCYGVTVTNTLDVPITNWTFVVRLYGTVVTDSWNAIRSGNTGTITLKPAYEWNSNLAPGESDDSVGFCASRPPGALSAVSQGAFTYQAP